MHMHIAKAGENSISIYIKRSQHFDHGISARGNTFSNKKLNILQSLTSAHYNPLSFAKQHDSLICDSIS